VIRKPVGWALGAMLASLAACGDSTGPGAGPDCNSVQPAALSPGQFTIIDPLSQGPCAIIPSAGSSDAEYLFAAVATAGQESQSGLSAQYTLTGSGGAPAASVAALPAPLLQAFRPPTNAARFHMMLRLREQAEAASPAAQFSAAIARGPAFALTAPAVGDKKTFQVCADTDCGNFVPVTATAMNVGDKVAIYQEDGLQNGVGFSQTDIDNVAKLFDNYLYPIDTTNFGRETDIDNNGVVEVLLSGKINKLSASFCKDGSVILGYFLSSDLLPNGQGNTGSNEGEVFYSIVPDPNSTLLPGCQGISTSFAQRNLAPTFIHEFQHMISYGQHVLSGRGGTSAEETWLNEGLSHYAEELGGRLIPDTANTTLPPGSNTYTQFALSDFQNAYDYLSNPEQTFLIEPRTSNGDLNERGANWLFVRWLVEGFGTATPNPAKPTFTVRATDMTRKLVQTAQIGATNVSSSTGGRSFNDLVVLWQLANYLDNLADFVPADSLLQYKSVDLRNIYSQLHTADANTFARVYPLIPDSTRGQYSRSGTLKQGSARHVRLQQAAGAPGLQLQLTGPAGAAISAIVVPRIGLVRIK
jgi:hypothetical protein